MIILSLFGSMLRWVAGLTTLIGLIIWAINGFVVPA